MKTFISIIFIMTSVLCQAQTNTLLKEKAQFILNITRYVRWENRDELGKTFDIAVVRSNDMAKQLRQQADNKTILGKKIKIVEFYKLDEIEACDIIFLSNDVFITDKTISVVKSRIPNTTLIVTDNAPRVAMINFFEQPVNNKLTFEVNQKNMENAHVIPLSGFLKNKKTRIKNDIMQ